ncbi:MAG: peptidylprolyl isomerase, partial [Alloprevotella sp.]
MKQVLLFLLLLITTPSLAQSPSFSAPLEQDIEVEFKTSMGDFRVRLFRDTPIHSRHFAQLVREGYYDGLLFHRVIRNFMIQAGDSTSRHAQPGQMLGEADRSYTLAPEFRTPTHYHRRGALAAARESDDVNPGRRSSATQFYVVWGKRWTPNELANVREQVDAETGENGLITDNMALDYYTRGGSPHLDG